MTNHRDVCFTWLIEYPSVGVFPLPCVVLHCRSQLYQHTTVHSRHLISALTPHVKTRGIINNNRLGSWVRVYRGTQALLHIPVVDPLSYFSFQPVLHDWCNEGCGMCYPVWDGDKKKPPPPKKKKQKKTTNPTPHKKKTSAWWGLISNHLYINTMLVPLGYTKP